MKYDELLLRDRLEQLYIPSSDDTFIADTVSHLPQHRGRRLWLVLFFAAVWGSFFGLLVAYRTALLAALREVMQALQNTLLPHIALPSPQTAITLLVIVLLFIIAVYESCQAVTDYVARSDGK